MTIARPIASTIARPISSPIDGSGGGGPGLPALPIGQAFLIDDAGNYLIDNDGDFLTADE